MITTVFLGTPEAAVPTLRRLAGASTVKCVVTMPDRPRGRSGRPVAPEVKVVASELGIAIAQPESRSDLDDVLDSCRPFDVGVVVAFGRILSGRALGSPGRGLLNVHFSLLPRWRGAAPVSRALMAGDTMTGVTIIELDEGLDTGPVLTAQAIDIPAHENAGDLTARLANIGGNLLVDSLGPYAEGSLIPVAQVDEGATYAKMLEPSDRVLTTEMSAADFVNHVRGLSPRPGAHIAIDGTSIGILDARVVASKPAPGTWVVDQGWPVVGLRDGGVKLTSMRPEGRAVMPGDAWARGRPARSGIVGS